MEVMGNRGELLTEADDGLFHGFPGAGLQLL